MAFSMVPWMVLWIVLWMVTPSVQAATAGQPPQQPDLSDLEPAVADQLRAAASTVEELQAATDRQALGEAYGRLGALYYLYELPGHAIPALERASELHEHARWPYLLALALEADGQFEHATGALELASGRSPRISSIETRLGLLLLKRNELDAAEDQLRRALQSSSDPAALEGLGQIALRRGQHQQAVDLLQQALSAVPEADRLHYALGQAYRNLGDEQRARLHLERYGTIGIRPRDPVLEQLESFRVGKTPHTLQGRKAFQAGSYAEAAAAFRRATLASPRDASARVNLATALSQLGQLEAAREELRSAVELDPDNGNALYNLGLLDRHFGDVESARRHLARAVELRPSDRDARIAFGGVLRDTGMSEAALAQLSAALELDSEDASSWLQLAGLQISIGELSAGLASLENAHRLAPSDGQTAAALARVLAASPNVDERDGSRALDLAQRVYSAAPSPLHAELVAQSLAELGRCNEAAQWSEASARRAGRRRRDPCAPGRGARAPAARHDLPPLSTDARQRRARGPDIAVQAAVIASRASGLSIARIF